MKKEIILGYFGPLIAIIGIATSAIINRSWWSLTNNAISDMGAVGVPYNYVLNVSFMISSVVTITSIGICIKEEDKKIIKLALGLFALSILNLFLIGTFPEGTKFHGFVSKMFFYIGTLSLLTAGLGMAYFKIKEGFIIIAIILIEILLGEMALHCFRGIAIAEIIAAIGITASYYIYLQYKMKDH